MPTLTFRHLYVLVFIAHGRRELVHVNVRANPTAAWVWRQVIEGLYDPAAAAEGAPSVRWFLGYDADGAPQFRGLPAHHTCPHRMDCSRCGLFIGGERARLVHDDPNLLRPPAARNSRQNRHFLHVTARYRRTPP